VVHNTPYDTYINNALLSNIKEQIKIGRYRPQYIHSMDETNCDFDQESGDTLVNRGDRTIGQSVTGSVNGCTVLLAVSTFSKNLLPYNMQQIVEIVIIHWGNEQVWLPQGMARHGQEWPDMAWTGLPWLDTT
jgi:hypothetical protein